MTTLASTLSLQTAILALSQGMASTVLRQAIDLTALPHGTSVTPSADALLLVPADRADRALVQRLLSDGVTLPRLWRAEAAVQRDAVPIELLAESMRLRGAAPGTLQATAGDAGSPLPQRTIGLASRKHVGWSLAPVRLGNEDDASLSRIQLTLPSDPIVEQTRPSSTGARVYLRIPHLMPAIVLPFQRSSLPGCYERVIAKKEFYLNLMGDEQLHEVRRNLGRRECALADGAIDALVRCANQYAVNGLRLRISLFDEVRVLSRGDGDYELIVRCDVDEGAIFHKCLEMFLRPFGLCLTATPPHSYFVTLYTSTNVHNALTGTWEGISEYGNPSQEFVDKLTVGSMRARLTETESSGNVDLGSLGRGGVWGDRILAQEVLAAVRKMNIHQGYEHLPENPEPIRKAREWAEEVLP